MNITHISTRKERREDAKQLTVSTWHAGKFGCWRWDELTQVEQREFEAARRRAAYVSAFGIYA